MNLCLLSALLAMTTSGDKDQVASITSLMDAIASQAADVAIGLDDGAPDSKKVTDLLAAECKKYSEQIKLAALGLAKSDAS